MSISTIVSKIQNGEFKLRTLIFYLKFFVRRLLTVYFSIKMNKRARSSRLPPEDDGESSDAPLAEHSRKKKKMDPVSSLA